jgi:hypothetical protein
VTTDSGLRRPQSARWCSQITADMGGEPLSEAQRQRVRRATTIAVQCELMEAEVANGRPIDLDGMLGADVPPPGSSAEV